jgi:hypothetical protein
MTELLQALNSGGVRYLLVGGQAMRLLGMPRYSMDWDLFVPPHDENNFAKLNGLLGDELDMPVVALGPRGENFIQTYQTRWGVIQFHLGLPGLDRFDAAEKRAVHLPADGAVTVPCLCGADLLAAKKASGRDQDQADIAFLEELRRLGKLH